jgi:hypothetical protein
MYTHSLASPPDSHASVFTRELAKSLDEASFDNLVSLSVRLQISERV